MSFWTEDPAIAKKEAAWEELFNKAIGGTDCDKVRCHVALDLLGDDGYVLAFGAFGSPILARIPVRLVPRVMTPEQIRELVAAAIRDYAPKYGGPPTKEQVDAALAQIKQAAIQQEG